ncbi:MAG TPA: hypothetical protein VMN99_02755, partial [Anaerolineales bacterium]|nr:hypothetical protein [Anaerolineales bacterium]
MDFTLVARIIDVLQIPPPSRLILLEARTLSASHIPPYPTDTPALLVNIDSRELALYLKSILLTTYPKEHVVSMVSEKNRKEESLA